MTRREVAFDVEGGERCCGRLSPLNPRRRGEVRSVRWPAWSWPSDLGGTQHQVFDVAETFARSGVAALVGEPGEVAITTAPQALAHVRSLTPESRWRNEVGAVVSSGW